jgi:hypothetical protein
MIPTVVLRRGGEGRVNDVVLGHFDMEEERGTDVEDQQGIDGCVVRK